MIKNQIKFFDSHVHFLWCGSFEKVKKDWQSLIFRGLGGIAAIINVDAPRDTKRYLEFIPTSYHKDVDAYFFKEGLGSDVSAARKLGDLEVFPYVDCRYLKTRDSDLTRFQEAGFRGLKVLYTPEEEEEMGIVGWRKFFGRSEQESQKVVMEMIKQAVTFGWPIIFHVNLKQYESFLTEVLETYKKHPFIIPHFGFSRKRMTRFLERFNSCYSDFSSLLPHMQKNPQGYLDFITDFQDRILFGSDTTLGRPELIEDYLDFVLKLIEDRNIQEKILFKNHLRIHS